MMLKFKLIIKRIVNYKAKIDASKFEVTNIQLGAIIRKLKLYYRINHDLKSYYFQELLANIDKNSIEGAKFEILSILKDESISEDIKILLVNLIYCCRVMDDELCEAVIFFAHSSQIPKYRYWLTLDISKITFALQRGFYKGYYRDRRALLKQIVLELNLIDNYKRSNNDKIINGDRLCIVTYLLDQSLKNSMQRVAVMFAEGLADKYREICVICQDSFYVSASEDSIFHTMFRREHSSVYQEAIRNMFPSNVSVFFTQKVNYEDRLQSCLDEINRFKPDVIIDLSDEYSAISYYYSQHYPTYYMPLRNYISSSYYSYIIAEAGVEKIVAANFDLWPHKVCNWVFPEYVPPVAEAYHRENYDLSYEKYLMLTIGNNSELTIGEFADKICRLLRDYRNLIWILVGSPASSYLHTYYQDLFDHQKIIEWGFENQLSSLCAMCDFLVRPDTTGSSGATAIAALNGLPIVMTKFLSDSTRWLGLDYSQNDNYADLAEEIIRLMTSREYYQERKNITLEKIKSAVNSNEKWDLLFKAIMEGDK